MINDRRQLADVFQQTIDIVQEGNYTSVNGEEVELLDNEAMLKGSRFYTKALDATSIPTIEGETKIIVENDDSIHCGHQLQKEGYNPMVLNLASRRNPGGGVLNGSRAQEESLFRCTNLFLSMYRYASYAEEYGLEKSKYQYPIAVPYGGIYVLKPLYSELEPSTILHCSTILIICRSLPCQPSITHYKMKMETWAKEMPRLPRIRCERY